MIFISILTLIVAKALPFLRNNISPILFTRISAIILIYAGVLTFNTLFMQSIGSGIGIYSGLFQVNVISHFMELFLLLIGASILIAWPRYLSSFMPNNRNISPASFIVSPDYCLIILFSTLGSCLLISSSDLVSMYLSIELQSFGLYVLATLYKDSESSTKAGLKYFLLGGLSSCIILLGSGLIYAFSGLTQFESIYSLVSAMGPGTLSLGGLDTFGALDSSNGLGYTLPSEVNNIILGLSLGLILIFIGFLFKIAAAPLHNWSPDVYDETPTIVTIWLTIMPKIAILILLLEVYSQIDVISLSSLDGGLTSLGTLSVKSGTITSSYLLKTLLLISSLLSLIIGTVVGLAQRRIKRLLAYSTIAHIGFILLALAINSEQSIESFLFYILQYSITNLDIFLIILALSYIIYPLVLSSEAGSTPSPFSSKGVNKAGGDITFISELKGQFFLNPILSISLSVCLFSMAGVPPLIGFFSKQFVLSSAMQNGYYFISLIAIIVSVISASYYLKIIKVLLTPDSNVRVGVDLEQSLNSEGSIKIPSTVISTTVSNLHSYIISILTLSILLFISKSSIILKSIQLLSLSLFYF